MSRAKNWCFTFNNPPLTEPVIWPWPHQVYGIYQYERGENGTLHLQGYAQFSTSRRLSQLKVCCPTAHWEVSRGTPAQASGYCSKLESRAFPDQEPFVYGSLASVSTQGKRTDVENAFELVRNGLADGTYDELEFATAHPGVWARYPTFGLRVRDLIGGGGHRPAVHVTLVIGPSGTGKSSYVSTQYVDAYWKSSGKWWDGYSGQAVVVFDDLDGSWFPISELLRIFNPFPYRVEIKGATTMLQATHFLVTTNIHPKAWYEKHFQREPEHWEALKRRINTVVQFFPDFSAISYDGTTWFNPPFREAFTGYASDHSPLDPSSVQDGYLGSEPQAQPL